MGHPVVDIFVAAREALLACPLRTGNVLRFGEKDQLIVAGDIHGNRTNLNRIVAHAKLAGNPKRHLVLQEIIHGGPCDDEDGDRSFELLTRVARLVVQHPGQVHLILSNHDIAQITGNEVAKDGRGACQAFERGLQNAYELDAGQIHAAICQMLSVQPLVARCPNGALIAHSLPSPKRIKFFDPQVLDRPYDERDFHRGQSVYELVWGRHQDEPTLEAMQAKLNCRLFVTGHQPQPNGFAVIGSMLVLSSDTPAGVIAEFDAGADLSPDQLSSVVHRIYDL